MPDAHSKNPINLESFALGIHHVGGIILALLMLMTAADVFGRYLFNHSLKWTIEISEVMLLLIVFFGAAYTALQKEHVRVELLITRFSKNAQVVIECFVSLLSFIMVSMIAVQGVTLALVQKSRGGVTVLLEIPLWPFALLLSFGAALLSIVLLKDTIRAVGEVFRLKWSRRQKMFLAFLVLLIAAVFLILGNFVLDRSQPIYTGIFGMILMLVLLFLGVPIGFCMALVGTAGMFYLVSPAAGLTLLQTVPYDTTSNYSLSVLPLFILMGGFAFHTGLSADLYRLVYRWLGHLPGGLAMATVGGCAGFAAVSGSSLATAATMGMVALPEMKRYKYDPALATGAIAAGGSLGIMIPPSVILIIYGIITGQSIATLFIAGFIPGILEALFYIFTIYLICKRNPKMGPPGERSSFKMRMLSFKETWGVLILFTFVIGGLYFGIFTPTEAGGMGAFGALVFIFIRRKFSRISFFSSLEDSVKTTAMCFILLIGAMMLGYFLTITQLPFALSEFVSGLPMNRYLILILILVVYLILGCIMDSLSIVLLTVPIFFPVVKSMGFDPIWFGILLVRVVEIGMITPPIGINVFIIKGVAGDVPMYTIFKGIVPFLIADIVHLALLLVVPQTVLILPKLLGMM
ncbi:MAG: TRAP transporter large permease subunit [Pseudomonadota bacterium]